MKEETKKERVVKQAYVTGIGSYMNLFKARSATPEAKPKFSVAILIPKKDAQLKELNKLVESVANEAFGPGWKKLQSAGKFWWPIQDGDDKEKEGYEGTFYINASNERRPGLVDINRNPIEDPEMCYSGCTIQANLNFFSYTYLGKSGVGAGLNSVRVIKRGTPLDGRSDPTTEKWPEVDGENDEAEAENLLT